MIVNAHGAILTAAHVVEGADAIKVTYADGKGSKAVVAGADAKRDIALLTPAELPETVVPAVLGGGVAVGDDVVAIGNPLGLTASTTSGVVSGLRRGRRGANRASSPDSSSSTRRSTRAARADHSSTTAGRWSA